RDELADRRRFEEAQLPVLHARDLLALRHLLQRVRPEPQPRRGLRQAEQVLGADRRRVGWERERAFHRGLLVAEPSVPPRFPGAGRPFGDTLLREPELEGSSQLFVVGNAVALLQKFELRLELRREADVDDRFTFLGGWHSP